MNGNTVIGGRNVVLESALMFALSALLPLRADVFRSPNGRVACDFTVCGGVPRATVSYDGRKMFEAELGVTDGAFAATGAVTRVVRSCWKPVWGFKASYPENYAERTVRLVRPGASRTVETLSMRCYDEGFAVRSKIALEVYGSCEIRRERTSWRFADGAKAWCIPGTESTFPEKPYDLATMHGTEHWRMPFTVEVPGVGAASVFEANVRDYPRSWLRVEKGVLRPTFVLGVKEGRGETHSPWRAVLMGADAGRLVETAYLVENLNDPCAIADTSWIRPGLSVSDAGNCELVTPQVIAAAQAAAQFGARYFQVDWGWYGTEYAWSDEDRAVYRAKHPELANDTTWLENTRADPYTVAVGTVPYHPYWPYGGRQGVSFDIPAVVRALKPLGMGLGLYVHGAVLEAHDLDRLFATYARWGVAALKPGFVSFGSQRATEWLRTLAATAARHRLWLDIHDAHVPDGFERTYPNVMITEGGGGEEGDHPLRQDVTLPFTRCLAGPFDFTPLLFKAKNGGEANTKAHKVAFFLCYPGPTAVMRGNVRDAAAKDASIMAFVKALPWNYDDTRVLDAAVGRHFVVARRRGDAWYLAGQTGRAARTTALDLSFLAADRAYRLTLWRDDLACRAVPKGYVRETRTVRRGDRVDVTMDAGGGFVATLVPEMP